MDAQLLEAIVGGTPGITITVSAQDLKEVLTGMIHNERQRIEEEARRNREQYIVSRNEAARQLNVTTVTLWEWARSGYLVPQKKGRKVFYRQSDIDNLNTPNA